MYNDTKNTYKHYARMLDRKYEDISCDELANEYCKALDNDDELNKNIYFSALMLKFWYTIDKLYKKSVSFNLERNDFSAWLAEAINYACKYRAWQDPKKHTNAQAAINQCISTIRLQHYYEANLDKHKASYNVASLDEPHGNSSGNDNEVDTLQNIIYDAADGIQYGKFGAECLVQTYIDNKQIIDAIIVDTIAFNDVAKHTSKVIKEEQPNGEEYKYVETYSQFWPYKLVKMLGTLPEDYETYFSKKYNVVKAELEASLGAIKKANNQKLYKYLNACLTSLKTKVDLI